MDYWKGPHSEIIAASPGFEEYRQIHLAETNPGLWPDTEGIETAIPADRKVDGIAEVTFESALSPVKGRAQTALAFEDEVNVFRRTLLYAGAPGTSRWHDVASPSAAAGARAVIYVHSVASWYALGGIYSASKAALWSATNSLRLELDERGVHVVGVHVGFVDTPMAAAANASGEIMAPQDLVRQVFDAVEADQYEVIADELSANVKAA